METRIQSSLFSAVIKLLRPLIRIFLRNGIPYGAFAELTRWVYVDVARREFAIQGRMQSDSRVSTITGLSRKEVRRLRRIEQPDDAVTVEQYHRAARVIAGWRRDPRFSDGKDRPRQLSLDTGEASFSALVRTYSGDVPPRAILDELLQIGAVRKSPEGKLNLVVDAYLPRNDAAQIHSILGSDVSMLINTIDHNMQGNQQIPWFQRKVAYNNIPREALETIRKTSSRDSQRLLEKLDRFIARHDRDINPDVDGSGRKYVGVGIYYFEDDTDNANTGSDGQGG